MSEQESEFQAPEPRPDEQPEPDEPGISDDEAAEQEDAEQADDEPDEQPEPEPTPADPQPESPDDRKRQRDAERTVKTYATKILGHFADQAEHLTDCPLCGGTQWPGFVHIGDAGRMPADVKNAVMAFLGYAAERDYPSVPDFFTCDACDGEGKVATGSKVPGKTTRDCPRCLGQGYRQSATSAENGTAHILPAVIDAALVPSGAGVPDTDPSGEPRLLPDGRENPNYGKWPQYKVPVEPWGHTAGLTVQDAAAT